MLVILICTSNIDEIASAQTVNGKLAKEHSYELDILYAQAFDKVDWESIHSSLWRVL